MVTRPKALVSLSSPISSTMRMERSDTNTAADRDTPNAKLKASALGAKLLSKKRSDHAKSFASVGSSSSHFRCRSLPVNELTDAEPEDGAVEAEHGVVDAEGRHDGGGAGHHERHVVDEQGVRPRAVRHPAAQHPPNRVRNACSEKSHLQRFFQTTWCPE